MRGVKEEVSGCKESFEKLLLWMNVIELNFNEWCKEKIDFKNEIDNLKKVNNERVKGGFVWTQLCREGLASENGDSISYTLKLEWSPLHVCAE